MNSPLPRPLLGWPLFPLPDEHGRLDWPDLEASVRQSIRVILSTRPGEQLMRPEFGAGLDRLLQEAEAVLGDQRTAVFAHTGDGFGYPGRVAREQGIVFRRTQEADDAELDDEVIDDFLGFRFGQRAFFLITLEVGVEEGRGAAKRHGGAVLFLHGSEIAEIQPLHGFLGCRSRLGDIKAVLGGHDLEFLERLVLFGQLFAITDDFVR